MNKYKFSISIPAASEQEATEKAQGLAVIASQLDAKTILALAHTIQNEPMKVAMAKRFLGA